MGPVPGGPVPGRAVMAEIGTRHGKNRPLGRSPRRNEEHSIKSSPDNDNSDNRADDQAYYAEKVSAENAVNIAVE